MAEPEPSPLSGRSLPELRDLLRRQERLLGDRRPGGAPPAEERRPEDATAARLPPLRHAPARLLPLAESVALQLRQEEARQEMQAKVAAQKLAERLGIKMVPYEPEGKMMTSYREARDEEGDSSAED